MEKFSQAEIEEKLATLDDWQIKDGTLCKNFKFADFKQAMEFINTLAVDAEKLNHHPDWSNSYNKVFIKLFTHDVSGLTGQDFELARSAEQIANSI